MKIQKGNALHLGGFGILISGPSGSGKSALTLMLIERGLHIRREVFLVGDDYVGLENIDGQIFASAPEQTAGAIEIRGAGLFKMNYKDRIRLDIAVELNGEGERYPEEHYFRTQGANLPLLKLPPLGTADMLCLCQAVEATLFRERWQPEFAEKNI